MTLYLDASAIVKLVSRERESDALRAVLLEAGETWTTSALSRTEVIRAVSRGGPAAIASARALLSRTADIVVTRTILDQAAELASPLRTLDAIHVASARRLGDELSKLITYDSRMATAAEDLGLTVEAPH